MNNYTKEYWFKISLNLKMRQVSGDEFQCFFSDVMEKLHGSDFVRVRPFGRKGDKGCDGYLLSSGEVYQCYGAINGNKSKVDFLIGKIKEDFEKAKTSLSKIMKEWHMVHNLVEGLPVEAIETLKELEEDNPEIIFGIIGREGIENKIQKLNDTDIEALLGPIATNRDSESLQTEELRNLIKGLVEATASYDQKLTPITPVSPDKLDFNRLPGYWEMAIESGWKNAHLVISYLDRHHNPLIGQEISRLFNEKYQYLRAQSLKPGEIMDSLYEHITGIGSFPVARQVAAQALLAYLFESCDIFENAPEAQE